MLRTRLILPLAFASVAFMWGCQEQGSSPVGPEGPGILLDKDGISHPHGGGTEDGTSTFAVSFEGAVVGGGELQGPHGGKNVLQEEFQVFVTLDLTGFQGFVDEKGSTCFPSTSIPSESGMQVGQVKPSNTEDAIINFFFRALGTAGEPDVDYVLKVFATFDNPGNWPPANENDTDKITGTSFVLAHVNGPGRKAACTGEGDLGEDDFELTVTRN